MKTEYVHIMNAQNFVEYVIRDFYKSQTRGKLCRYQHAIRLNWLI